jgi:hypothetical protein
MKTSPEKGYAAWPPAQRRTESYVLPAHSTALLHECDTVGAIVCLRGAEAFAEEVAPPGELYERRGEVSEARKAYSRAARSLRALAAKIGDKVPMGFLLAALRGRRVLECDWSGPEKRPASVKSLSTQRRPHRRDFLQP